MYKERNGISNRTFLITSSAINNTILRISILDHGSCGFDRLYWFVINKPSQAEHLARYRSEVSL